VVGSAQGVGAGTASGETATCEDCTFHTDGKESGSVNLSNPSILKGASDN